MKEFNTTGICNPDKHYMVDISERLKEIKAMVDAGKYFCINRARQYGKTTTLAALATVLSPQYNVTALDFQGIDEETFKTGGDFTQGLARLFLDACEFKGVTLPQSIQEAFETINDRDTDKVRMDEIFRVFRRWCKDSSKEIVLMIDEVDTAADNQVFLDFLAQLRLQYLEREKYSDYPAFHSVILAGVTDVRHLKAKLRSEDEHRTNSPWNIASDFAIDMSLPESGIKGMLDEYEADHHTGMDTLLIAKRLWEYTNGYPYLVSRLCQLTDGIVSTGMGAAGAWTEEGLDEAIKILLADGDDTLFGSLMSKLENMPQLKGQLRDILMKGDVIAWQPYDEEQALLRMYGFITNNHNTVAVANRIFEMLLYHYFLGETNRNDAFRSDAGMWLNSKSGEVQGITRTARSRSCSIWIISAFQPGIW